MSRINFGKYNAEHPELRPAFQRLDNWFESHRGITTVNSVALSRALRDVPAEQLTAAIYFLVGDGVLTQWYQFITPQGELVGEPLDDPLDPWPDVVESDLGNRIPVDDCELVPVWSVQHRSGGRTS
jgi:hypothetical protein